MKRDEREVSERKAVEADIYPSIKDEEQGI